MGAPTSGARWCGPVRGSPESHYDNQVQFGLIERFAAWEEHERRFPAFAARLRRMKIAVGELQSLVEQVLVRHGVAAARAPLLAGIIVAAERDGR